MHNHNKPDNTAVNSAVEEALIELQQEGRIISFTKAPRSHREAGGRVNFIVVMGDDHRIPIQIRCPSRRPQRLEQTARRYGHRLVILVICSKETVLTIKNRLSVGIKSVSVRRHRINNKKAEKFNHRQGGWQDRRHHRPTEMTLPGGVAA